MPHLPTDRITFIFLLSNHLDSNNVQMDGSAALVNREEFYPFGETSFGYQGKKRYRFTGKERDEESGLYYYGARYYMPWFARFSSTDQLAELFAYQGSYVYADDNPVMNNDPTGMASEDGQPKNPGHSGGKKVPRDPKRGTELPKPYEPKPHSTPKKGAGKQPSYHSDSQIYSSPSDNTPVSIPRSPPKLKPYFDPKTFKPASGGISPDYTIEAFTIPFFKPIGWAFGALTKAAIPAFAKTIATSVKVEEVVAQKEVGQVAEKIIERDAAGPTITAEV
jgi:RHS repeat-associated protein